MVREVYFFTEMGYTAYSQAEERRYGYNNLMFPNEQFSPERAQRQRTRCAVSPKRSERTLIPAGAAAQSAAPPH